MLCLPKSVLQSVMKLKCSNLHEGRKGFLLYLFSSLLFEWRWEWWNNRECWQTEALWNNPLLSLTVQKCSFHWAVFPSSCFYFSPHCFHVPQIKHMQSVRHYLAFNHPSLLASIVNEERKQRSTVTIIMSYFYHNNLAQQSVR